jgi:hypothetical protein
VHLGPSFRVLRSSGHASGSAIGTTCAKRDPASGGVLRVFASRARSKSREIDSISPAGSIRFHALRGSRPLRTSAGGLPHSIDPANLGLPSSFAGFCPGWGVHRRRDASRGLPPHARSLVRCLYNGCVIARCGFGDLACDSVREGRTGGHQPLVAVRAPAVAVSIDTIRKYRIETVSCREISITNACYLCNTLWKRGGLRSLEAVP